MLRRARIPGRRERWRRSRSTCRPKIAGLDAPPVSVAVAPAGDRALVATGDASSRAYQLYIASLPSLERGRGPRSPSQPIAAGIVAGADRGYVAQKHPDGRITFVNLKTGEARRSRASSSPRRSWTGASHERRRTGRGRSRALSWSPPPALATGACGERDASGRPAVSVPLDAHGLAGRRRARRSPAERVLLLAVEDGARARVRADANRPRLRGRDRPTPDGERLLVLTRGDVPRAAGRRPVAGARGHRMAGPRPPLIRALRARRSALGTRGRPGSRTSR